MKTYTIGKFINISIIATACVLIVCVLINWFDITMQKNTFVTESEQECWYFMLATNNLTLTPKELLDEHKSQQRVGRRFRFLKSPKLLSDALFLKKPQSES